MRRLQASRDVGWLCAARQVVVASKPNRLALRRRDLQPRFTECLHHACHRTRRLRRIRRDFGPLLSG
jgi:hypothetical protein